MAFRGDFKKLGAIVERIGQIATGDFVRRSAEGLGRTALDLAQRGAAAARSPAGRPWKPLKNGGGTALRKAASALSLTTFEAGFRIGASLGWLFFHQSGAKRVTRAAGFRRSLNSDGKLTIKRAAEKVGWRLPARRMLPGGSLPSAWSEPMLRKLVAEWAKTWR